MAHRDPLFRSWPTVDETCDRLAREFACEVTVSAFADGRMFAIVRVVGSTIRCAQVHDRGRGLERDLLESILNRLDIRPEDFGIIPDYDA